MTAEEIINYLELRPHPEGGWYRQTWAAKTPKRPAGTCIYFLLKEGESSAWHRVDAGEIWHFYSGDPLILRRADSVEGFAFDTVLVQIYWPASTHSWWLRLINGKPLVQPENIRLLAVQSALDLSFQVLNWQIKASTFRQPKLDLNLYFEHHPALALAHRSF